MSLGEASSVEIVDDGTLTNEVMKSDELVDVVLPDFASGLYEIVLSSRWVLIMCAICLVTFSAAFLYALDKKHKGGGGD